MADNFSMQCKVLQQRGPMTTCNRLFGCLILVASLLLPVSAHAADLGDIADSLGALGDLINEADRARERFEQRQSDRSYEREWRDREYRLEEGRIDTLARKAGVSRDRIRDMRRDGASWTDICRRYDLDPRTIGYGTRTYRGYDREHDDDLYRGYYRDHPHGGPPGLMKKGGMPPGQAKKNQDYDDDAPGKGNKGKGKHKD